jgi:alpha-N-acetylglucosaminidase
VYQTATATRMKLFISIATAIGLVAVVSAQSTAGLKSLLERRMPNHVKDFDLKIVNATMLGVKNTTAVYDSYSVTSKKDGRVEIHGTTVSALSLGLHRYATDVLHLDIYWFVGSRLYLAPTPLPQVNGTLIGSSVVPWRYHFNTGASQLWDKVKPSSCFL